MNRIPLVALSGLLNDARVWQHQAAALAGSRRVATADTFGHDAVAALAAAALAQAPAGRFALAGFSLGGYVALEIMRQAPERVAALALLDTSARPDTAQAIGMRRAMIAGARSGGGAGPGFEAVATAFLPRVVHPSRVGDAALIAVLADMARAVGLEGFVRQQHAAMTRPDSRPLLKDIRCPTLVLCGREDLVVALEAHEELAAGIAGARLVVVDECGHMSPLERPERVTQALTGWLDSVQD